MTGNNHPFPTHIAQSPAGSEQLLQWGRSKAESRGRGRGLGEAPGRAGDHVRLHEAHSPQAGDGNIPGFGEA